jgi:hypothetical protein
MIAPSLCLSTTLFSTIDIARATFWSAPSIESIAFKMTMLKRIALRYAVGISQSGVTFILTMIEGDQHE